MREWLRRVAPGLAVGFGIEGFLFCCSIWTGKPNVFWFGTLAVVSIALVIWGAIVAAERKLNE